MITKREIALVGFAALIVACLFWGFVGNRFGWF